MTPGGVDFFVMLTSGVMLTFVVMFINFVVLVFVVVVDFCSGFSFCGGSKFCSGFSFCGGVNGCGGVLVGQSKTANECTYYRQFVYQVDNKRPAKRGINRTALGFRGIFLNSFEGEKLLQMLWNFLLRSLINQVCFVLRRSSQMHPTK